MKDKIKFVKSIKKFGEKELGLNFAGSFSRMAKDSFSCNWVYACYKNKMESVFEKRRPFEFYTEMEKALERQKELDKKKYDTYFYHAEAHGGGKCPITKEMIESDKARQCYVVLHEAWHTKSRINGHNFPYPFEESSGRVVGLFGGMEFARYLKDDELLKMTTDQETAWSMFADFVNDSYSRLKELEEEKASVVKFTELKRELNSIAAELYKTVPDSWEKSELKKEINNAFILRYYDYTVHYPIAKKIYLKSGSLRSAMEIYSKLFLKAKSQKQAEKVINRLNAGANMKNCKTYYIGHEGAYKNLKATGKSGWASEEDNIKFEKVIEVSLKRAKIPNGGKVLELGCGAGDMTLVLTSKDYETYGIDISPTAIEWAKEKAAERNLKADFRVGSVLDLSDFPEDYFDYILDGHCLHCIIGKDREKFLSEALRVLKHGGIFFSETMCGEVREEWKNRFDESTRCLMIKDVAERYIGLPEYIVEEVKSAGFKVLNYEVSPDPEAQDDLRILATKN